MSKFFSRRSRSAPGGGLPSAIYFLQWAGLLIVMFIIARLAGLREFTSVLNGTIGSTSMDWKTAAFLGVSYVFIYLGVVIVVPVLVLGALILKIWQRMVPTKGAADDREETLKRIKWLTWLFIIGLFVSGATAIPLRKELDLAVRLLGGTDSLHQVGNTGFTFWIVKVREAVRNTDLLYPFMAYGTDWLAFGHFAIAIAFVGALRDPVRNRWALPIRHDFVRAGDSVCDGLRRRARDSFLLAAD